MHATTIQSIAGTGLGMLRPLVLCICLLISPLRPAAAESVVEVPMLAAIQANHLGVFEVLLLRWDHQPSPSPIMLQWQGGNIKPGQTNLGSMALAFQYALDHTPNVDHRGTVSVIGIAYASTGTDGPSAGGVMTVGFAALLKGDKIRAAAREGYRTILIPQGQHDDPRWNLTRLAWDLNVEVKEVSTVEEAYHLMTGGTLD